MNSQRQAQRAYQSTQTPIRTPRSTEYEAFARITHRLASTARQGKAGFAALADALHENRRLWTVLAAAVADDENALPHDLRARLFYLAEFTDTHSRKVLRGQATVAPLIEVNTAVMRGLKTEGAAR
ncbi:flagellar protein FlaF [Lutimaribacter pacificus]|uniref:Flagellar protein FlaF n=1 Tax=Lutimaribacter pacificus TaxID=391948 RepID=A0A1H0EBW2_9RHOB|nr:flagellar biosynthesis regulator FlaF [Lutimaribacter pacificus]SDN79860.1 flagellar protein FlaF [Lutimaribacter pacificus]SHK54451.1 flagellar protein FlaF [Lutimaribacter pacificus]